MQRAKQASKRKQITQTQIGKARITKAAVPALGLAGLTFSLAGQASASALPTSDLQQKPNFMPRQVSALSEEELADVSLATFHLADDHEGLAMIDQEGGRVGQALRFRSAISGGRPRLRLRRRLWWLWRRLDRHRRAVGLVRGMLCLVGPLPLVLEGRADFGPA